MKEIAELKNEVRGILSPQTVPIDGSSKINGLKISSVVDLKVIGES